jgi:hypothetical protein
MVFNRHHHRHGVYRFFLPTAWNKGDHDHSAGSGQSVTDAIADAPQDDRWRGTEE